MASAILVEIDEMEGRRLRVVRPRAVPARSPMIARRFDERAQLGVDGVLDYVRGNVSAQPPWFATVQPDGLSLDEWLAAIDTRGGPARPSLALRVVFDLASLGREIYKASTTLPAAPLADLVLDREGRTWVGYLGEFSTRVRPEESTQLPHLARLARQLAGPDLPADLDDAIGRWETGNRLAEVCDAIELLWLGHPDLEVGHSRIAEVVRQVLEASPPIAPPTWASVSDEAGREPALSLDGVSTLKMEPIRPPPDAATPSTLGIGRDPQSGATVGGKYRLVRSLGGGAMGQVYEASHLTRGQVCAVKVLRAQGANARAMEEFAERFRREARAMSALDHPNVVAVHDFGSDDVCWLAMDLVPGPSLSTLLASEGPLPVRDAIEVAQQLSLALAYAHARGIVHRDLKPANVLVCERNPIRVKLADFGLAKSWHDADYTIEGTLVGTPQYMSPEQCQGQPATPHSDIYALGLVLYRMLTGRTPFEDHKGAAVLLAHTTVAPLPMSSYRAGIPRSVERLVARCLEKSPEARFVDAGAVGKALAECLVESRSGSWSVPSPTAPPSAPASNRPPSSGFAPMTMIVAGLASLVLLVVVVLAAGGAWWLVSGTVTPPTASPSRPLPAPTPAPTVVVEPAPAPAPAVEAPETLPAPLEATEAPVPAVVPRAKPAPRATAPRPVPASEPATPTPVPPAEPSPGPIPSSAETDLKNPFKR